MAQANITIYVDSPEEFARVNKLLRDNNLDYDSWNADALDEHETGPHWIENVITQEGDPKID